MNKETKRAIEKLAQAIEELEISDIPVDKLEVFAEIDRGHDATCGVCDKWYSYGQTFIVDSSEFDYDFDTEFDDAYNGDSEQQRICSMCVGEWLQTGEVGGYSD